MSERFWVSVEALSFYFKNKQNLKGNNLSPLVLWKNGCVNCPPVFGRILGVTASASLSALESDCTA